MANGYRGAQPGNYGAADAQAELDSLTGSGFGMDPRDPPVWWRHDHSTPNLYSPSAAQYGIQPSSSVERFEKISSSEASLMFYRDDSFSRQVIKKMLNLGLIKTSSFAEASQVWDDAVAMAGRFAAADRRITPFMALDFMGGAGGGARGPTSQTQRSYQIISRASANAYVRAMFKEQLGRNPTRAELKKWSGRLIAKSEADPTVTTSTTTYSGQNASTVSRTREGFSDAEAEEYMRSTTEADPEFGAYQAATTYFNALMSAIG